MTIHELIHELARVQSKRDADKLNHHVGSGGRGRFFSFGLRPFVHIVRLLREKGEAGFGSPTWSALVGRRGKPKGLPFPCGLPTCVRPAARAACARDASSRTLNLNEKAFPRGETICQEIYSRLIGWITPCLHSKGSATSSPQSPIFKKFESKGFPCSSGLSPTRSGAAPKRSGAPGNSATPHDARSAS